MKIGQPNNDVRYVPSLAKKPTQKKVEVKLNKVPGLPALSITLPEEVRPSYVKSFMGCPHKYELEQIHKVPTKFKEGYFSGNLIDAATTAAMVEVLNGRNDMPIEYYVSVAKEAAYKSYQDQCEKILQAGGMPYWMKSLETFLPKIFWTAPFMFWLSSRLDLKLIGVQKSVEFDYRHRSGIVIHVKGTTDIVAEDLIIDCKKTSRSPLMRKTDTVTGKYITDEYGQELKFADVSPEYKVQLALYMRGLDIHNSALDYFVMTKEPKYEVVNISDSKGLQATMDIYLNKFIEAHIDGVFMPNIYYDWCETCEFHSHTCKYTERYSQ